MIERGAIGAFLLAALAVGAAAQPAAPKPPPYAPVSFVEVRGRVLAPVYLDGVGPYGMLVDSGSTQPLIDAQVAASFGIPANTGEGRLRSIRVGAFDARDQRVDVADLSALQRALGPEVQGILPAGWGEASLVIDFPRGLLYYQSQPVAATPELYPYSAPLKREAGGIYVDVILDGKHARPARIDTAHAGLLTLPTSLAQDLDLVRPGSPRIEFEKPADGPMPMEGAVQVRLRQVGVGGALFDGPICTLAESGGDPVLGTDFLRHFRVLFDFRGSRIHLHPVKPMPLRGEPVVGYGLILGPRLGPYWTVLTAVNSPAFRAGICSGDRLVGVDETHLENAGIGEAAAALVPRPGRSAIFRFLQGDAPRTCELAAEPLL